MQYTHIHIRYIYIYVQQNDTSASEAPETFASEVPKTRKACISVHMPTYNCQYHLDIYIYIYINMRCMIL